MKLCEFVKGYDVGFFDMCNEVDDLFKAVATMIMTLDTIEENEQLDDSDRAIIRKYRNYHRDLYRALIPFYFRKH